MDYIDYNTIVEGWFNNLPYMENIKQEYKKIVNCKDIIKHKGMKKHNKKQENINNSLNTMQDTTVPENLIAKDTESRKIRKISNRKATKEKKEENNFDGVLAKNGNSKMPLDIESQVYNKNQLHPSSLNKGILESRIQFKKQEQISQIFAKNSDNMPQKENSCILVSNNNMPTSDEIKRKPIFKENPLIFSSSKLFFTYPNYNILLFKLSKLIKCIYEFKNNIFYSILFK